MEDISPLVSVIIPVYNVKHFINRGIKNILSQTYLNYEVLLIDDGSTDGSGELCDNWSREKENIKTFHKENEGAGSARNLGIKNAKGKYIYFFDIDDLASPELLAYNVEIMERKQVEVIIFGFTTIETDCNNLKEDIFFKEQEINSNLELKNIYIDTLLLVKNGNGFPWNKFYRRSFLEEYNLLYEDQRIQQDEVFNINVYKYLSKAYISPKILYKYFIYNKGNTRSYFIADRFDIYVSVRDNFEYLRNLWNIDDIRFDEYLNKRFYGCINNCIQFNMFHKDCNWSLNKKRKEINRIMDHPYTQKAILDIENSDYLNIEQRLYLHSYKAKNLLLVGFYNKIHALLKFTKNKLIK